MYCKYCAALIDDDSLVCSACGKTLGQSISSPIPQTPYMMPQSQVQQFDRSMPQPDFSQPEYQQTAYQQPVMQDTQTAYQQPVMQPVYQQQQPVMQSQQTLYQQPQQPVYQQPGYQPQPQAVQQPVVMPNIVINNSSNATVNTANNVGALNGMISDKSKIAALLLCLFGGTLGLHQFYAGKIGMGILYICTAGLCGFGALIDFFLVLFGKFRDQYGRFIAV